MKESYPVCLVSFLQKNVHTEYVYSYFVYTVKNSLADTLCTILVYCIFVYTGKKCVS